MPNFFQNDDIAVVSRDGVLSLHRIKRERPVAEGGSPRSKREVDAAVPPSPRTIDILDSTVKSVDIHGLLLREIHEQV